MRRRVRGLVSESLVAEAGGRVAPLQLARRRPPPLDRLLDVHLQHFRVADTVGVDALALEHGVEGDC